MKETGIKAQVINEIQELAKKYGVKKVLLFGSRARGDFKRTSDIDLAALGGNVDRFALDVKEDTSTLLKYDIVNLDRDMQDELREAICREGIVIRGRMISFWCLCCGIVKMRSSFMVLLECCIIKIRAFTSI